MKMKRFAALALLCSLLLTACAAPEQVALPTVTLPPAADDAAAPIGDAALTHTATFALYLPSRDGQRLICQYASLTLNRGRHPAEAVARALLEHPGDETVAPLGGNVTLRLNAGDPVELSGDVCTVNLMPSALQLHHDDLYAACLALTTTLCELPGIRAVNVLVGGQAVGLDVADRLPLGSLSPHSGAELSILWSQMAARRVPVGSDPADVPLTAAATLYYPLSTSNGIIPEARTLSFAGQQPAQLIQTLLTALTIDPAQHPEAIALPNLSEMLTEPPTVADLETGGRMATLRFSAALTAALERKGLDMACFAASVTCTLTTFVPSLASVQLIVGDQPVTNASSQRMSSLILPGGVARRADFAAYIRAQANVYLPQRGKLEAITRRLPDDDAYHPRALLLALMAGPTDDEREAGVTPLLPEGLSDADILGIAVSGDTLLVNLSARAADRIRESELDQHLMCRGLVSALCELMKTPRVRFFFGSESVETLNGPIFWGGSFLYNPSLTQAAGGD